MQKITLKHREAVGLQQPGLHRHLHANDVGGDEVDGVGSESWAVTRLVEMLFGGATAAAPPLVLIGSSRAV